MLHKPHFCPSFTQSINPIPKSPPMLKHYIKMSFTGPVSIQICIYSLKSGSNI
ncbi:hypothetical protein CLOSTMETH_03674 [[Clostridium] methylpentosum DSM 5476]|uniref:Uncharacterized protein n=1 Tax=[Clostridium] methylpentosum DSM 5476 TaxID=537013 RepID=C0EII0_9FIRM|nr:hypothetical protein CLOSTMETH_03674 [[Clostridium] methylpentosum DSM 5476]